MSTIIYWISEIFEALGMAKIGQWIYSLDYKRLRRRRERRERNSLQAAKRCNECEKNYPDIYRNCPSCGRELRWRQ